jgi:hypothetical protein
LSFAGFDSIRRSPIILNILNTLDIKIIIQNAISPLIKEIRELKEKIKQLKEKNAEKPQTEIR